MGLSYLSRLSLQHQQEPCQGLRFRLVRLLLSISSLMLFLFALGACRLKQEELKLEQEQGDFRTESSLTKTLKLDRQRREDYIVQEFCLSYDSLERLRGLRWLNKVHRRVGGKQEEVQEAYQGFGEQRQSKLVQEHKSLASRNPFSFNYSLAFLLGLGFVILELRKRLR